MRCTRSVRSRMHGRRVRSRAQCDEARDSESFPAIPHSGVHSKADPDTERRESLP
jgi:hypothetical protein